MGANKRVSRVLSLVLALALVFTMYVPVHAAVAPLLTMDVAYDSFENDATVEVTVGLNGETVSASAFTGGVAFDTAVLELQSAVNSSGKTGIKIQVWNAEDEEWGATSLGKSTVDEANGNGHFGFYYTPTDVCKYQLDGDFIVKLTFKVLDASSSTKIYLYEDMDLGEAGAVKYDPSKNSDEETAENTVELSAPKSIADATIGEIEDQVYTGKALKPAVKVTYDGATLKEGTDYEVAYKNNTNAGTASVTVTGKGAFTGTKTASFKITVEKKEADELSAEDVDAPFNTTTIETELTGIPEDAEDVEVELSVASGSAIITNLKYDPETGKITGDVEGAAEGDEVEVTVTVTSSNYKEATTTFTVSFGSQAYNIVVTGGKADKETAQEGDTVTITAEVPKGQKFSKWTVASGSAVVLADETKATTTFTMPGEDVDITAEFVKKSSSGGGSSSGSSKKFTDVPEDSYFYDPVYWAVDKGITKGTSSTKFSPFLGTTRADFVTFLYRAEGSPKVSGETPFEDLDKDAYYYDAVLWAWNNGITIGTSATTFSPSMTVTRGQAVTFLYRHAGEPAVGTVNPFTDVAESDYYYNAILWAVNKKITTGTTETTFEPNRDSYRAEVVTFLYRELK
ncbi:MAG: S-layer homology domain-containing protein [Firmicutes bacterium]|nr:S-layer homology domain-containing protein [Bacillota bacterium]